ncbi:MAG TPA: HD domain-containing phosphohydrolase [Candidatus Polarisedimenticolia bacterium]|jgi:putative two-component system response regulator|nr:HD domain-containing phosphohydrolase [Candidatus Polarisedimenticolia bacterium]
MQKILIVDDDAANRELLESVLELTGFSVTSAGDGRQALMEFERISPDLVLLDVQMPILDGFEVCRKLKSNSGTRLTPVVLVTALSATEDRVRGLEAGADDFLIKPVDRSELLARVRSLLSLKAFTDELEQAETVLFSLALSIEGKDPYTEGHCQRLSDYSAYLGERMGLPLEQITALRRAGVVHDIGKIAVPDAILLKPAKLTPEEFKVMQQHPLVGERICRPLKSFRLVLPIIRHHHEKLNGTGYPDGLKGDQIPLTARILQVVDVFDALTTLRPYKRALSISETLEVMDEEVKKGWWDPDIFSQFKQLVAGLEDLNSMMGNGDHLKATSAKRM